MRPKIPFPGTQITNQCIQIKWLLPSTNTTSHKTSQKNNKTEEKTLSTSYLPYTQTTYGYLSRMLPKYNIKCIAITPKKISSYMPLTKDAPALRTPDIHKIPCECSKVYIGQSGRSIQLRKKENERHIRLFNPKYR